jgi:hypothetical protein
MSKPDHTARVLATLNALPRRKGKGRLLTPSDLLNLETARFLSGKPLGEWSEDSLFITASTLVELYRTLTKTGRAKLADSEMVGGWFEEQGDDDCDEDGDFCSTPSHYYGDDDAPPSLEDFTDAIEHCSRNGVLFLY